MNDKIFLLCIVGIQVLFIALDCLHVHYKRTRQMHNKEKRLTTSAFLFLFVITIVYGTIPFGGLLLFPKIGTLIDWFKIALPSFYAFQTTSAGPSLFGWSALGVFTIYIAGFWDYVTHRFMSHSKQLFFTHEYHHLPNRLFLALPGLSVRPFVAIAILPATIGTVFSLVLILKFFNIEHVPLTLLIYTIIALQTIILAVTHSEFFMGQWWIYNTVKYAFVTSPQEHEMHHTVDLRGNYGNFTVLWDKIFGTYINPTKEENKNHLLGLSYDQDFLGALTAGKLKIPKKVREKFQIERYSNIDE